MPYIPIKGFAPDADPREPGIIVDCDLVVPTLNGIAALAGNSDVGAASVASTVVAATAIKKLDDSNRIFAATQGPTSKLYELSTTTWNDRSHAAGTYSATANARWTFAQYRDVTLAAQKGEKIQASGTTGASLTFKTVAAAPKAKIVEVVGDFVMAFNVDDGGATYGNDPQRWWCAAAGDHTDWTPSVATQSATGELNDTPGPINAAKRLGRDVVVYKERSMYLGRYVGAPQVWAFQLIPGEGLGTWSPYSVVDIETAHLFIGFDNIYSFDGTRPVPIATNRVAEYFLETVDFSNMSKIIGYHYRQDWQVFWFYPTAADGSGELTQYLCYNYRSDRWTKGDKVVQFSFEFLEPGVSYDEVGTFYSTYNDLPNSPYDTLFAATGSFKPACFWNNKLYKMEGVAGQSSITTGELGTDGMTTIIDRIRPRFKNDPNSGTAARYYKENSGESTKTATTGITLQRGTFDNAFSARWHQYAATFTGDMEVVGLHVDIRPDGIE